MKFRQFTMPIGCSALGALGLMAALPPQALGDEARTQAASPQHHQIGYDQKKVNELVKIVREATVRFRDVAAAEAEQYKLNFGCVTGGDWGAMGLHYVNMPLVLDGNLDATRPEIVIYEPLPNGRLRITGADYLVLAEAWDAKKIGPPQLNGQLFHHFPAPNRFGLPAFYTLHVWAWKDNPTGTFTNWHPNVSCDAFDAK